MPVSTLDEFESFLEAIVDGAPDDANRPLIREHFGRDDPTSKRGKRMRPRILLTVAESEGVPARVAFGAAAALELLHNFSLIHDDMEDGDELRHGRPTLWARFGIEAALVAGNAMSALAYLTLIDGSPDLAPPTVAAMLASLQLAHYRMCEGQAFDIGFERSPAVTFDEYLRMIEGKTAALLGASCELGALSAGCSGERAAAYGNVGRVYGLAFQVRDDALGAWGYPKKPANPRAPTSAAASGRSQSPGRSPVRPQRSARWWRTPMRRSARSTMQRPTAVIGALDRLGARRAADDACDACTHRRGERDRRNARALDRRPPPRSVPYVDGPADRVAIHFA